MYEECIFGLFVVLRYLESRTCKFLSLLWFSSKEKLYPVKLKNNSYMNLFLTIFCKILCVEGGWESRHITTYAAPAGYAVILQKH